MIRSDYEEYLIKIKESLRSSDILYIDLDQSQLGVKFELTNKWILEVDCERFGSGVTISINNRSFGRKDGYAIWILMLAFENLTGIKYGKPTIENQIKFLEKEKSRIFESSGFYDNEYSNLNDI
jgi:hypothetical protein